MIDLRGGNIQIASVGMTLWVSVNGVCIARIQEFVSLDIESDALRVQPDQAKEQTDAE